MHADLQDPPELIPDMLRIARDGADVVYARRIGRDEPWHKRLLATAFYKLMERLARVPYQGQLVCPHPSQMPAARHPGIPFVSVPRCSPAVRCS